MHTVKYMLGYEWYFVRPNKEVKNLLKDDQIMAFLTETLGGIIVVLFPYFQTAATCLSFLKYKVITDISNTNNPRCKSINLDYLCESISTYAEKHSVGKHRYTTVYGRCYSFAFDPSTLFSSKTNKPQT